MVCTGFTKLLQGMLVCLWEWYCECAVCCGAPTLNQCPYWCPTYMTWFWYIEWQDLRDGYCNVGRRRIWMRIKRTFQRALWEPSVSRLRAHPGGEPCPILVRSQYLAWNPQDPAGTVAQAIGPSEPMQNDQTCFFSNNFLKFYNIIKTII